jgi:hypothetical protein
MRHHWVPVVSIARGLSLPACGAINASVDVANALSPPCAGKLAAEFDHDVADVGAGHGHINRACGINSLVFTHA